MSWVSFYSLKVKGISVVVAVNFSGFYCQKKKWLLPLPAFKHKWSFVNSRDGKIVERSRLLPPPTPADVVRTHTAHTFPQGTSSALPHLYSSAKCTEKPVILKANICFVSSDRQLESSRALPGLWKQSLWSQTPLRGIPYSRTVVCLCADSCIVCLLVVGSF